MNKEQALYKINEMMKNTMVDHLGIIITDFGEKFITGKMPVDRRTGKLFSQ